MSIFEADKTAKLSDFEDIEESANFSEIFGYASSSENPLVDVYKYDDVTHVELDFHFDDTWHKEYKGKEWASLVDSNGYFTEITLEHIESVFTGLFGDSVEVKTDNESVDMDNTLECVIRISFDLPNDKTVKDLTDMVYNVCVEYNNVTDPGTFGSEYLFSIYE